MNKSGFNKGDRVKLINNDHIYASYTDFIKRHKKYMLKWAYKSRPIITHAFTVLGIHKHVSKRQYDKNDYCIAIQDNTTSQIFLTGETALKKLKTKN